LLGVGLIAVPVALTMESMQQPPKPAAPLAPVLRSAAKNLEQDARTIRLQKFLAHLHCPVQNLATEFIRAADANHLDWRLLPSISVIESGGGKDYRNNNIFGWNKGDEPFSSVRDSIHVVASKLGGSPLYRKRDLEGKLRIYNPDEAYPQTVISVMNRIGPAYDSGLRNVLAEED
jgi:hypothetical protein